MADAAGFLSFIRDVAVIPSAALPDNAAAIPAALNFALEVVNLSLAGMPVAIQGQASLYDLAVYNLGVDYLINWAPDVSGSTYFKDLRKEWNINTFVAGVVQSTGDEGTNTSLKVPAFMEALMLGDLQMLKTPFGRQYLSIAQRMGTLWGIT